MLDSTFERKAAANETNGRANDTDFYSAEIARVKNTISDKKDVHKYVALVRQSYFSLHKKQIFLQILQTLMNLEHCDF